MVSVPVVVGISFIICMLAVGVAQTIHLPGSSLAGAVTEHGKDQQAINLCMNGCMHGCVTEIETEPGCRAVCERKCDA